MNDCLRDQVRQYCDEKLSPRILMANREERRNIPSVYVSVQDYVCLSTCLSMLMSVLSTNQSPGKQNKLDH